MKLSLTVLPSGSRRSDMLRSAALAIAICILGIAVAAAIFDHAAWPAVFWIALIAAALAFERQRYGAAQIGRPGHDWQATGERFFDDASGLCIEVWFNPASGERRYVQHDGSRHRD